MQPQDPAAQLLNQLRDISEPSPIGFWPLAPGWWILSVLIILVVVASVFLFKKYKQQRAWKIEALREFDKLKIAYHNNPSNSRQANIVALIKRSVATAYRTPNCLAWPAEYWRHFVKEEAGTALADRFDDHYSATHSNLSEEELSSFKKLITAMPLRSDASSLEAIVKQTNTERFEETRVESNSLAHEGKH